MEVTDMKVNDSTVELFIKMERRICSCPKCGAPTDRVHDYRTQRVIDMETSGRRLIWVYRKRRYVCDSCKARFYERCALLPRYCRETNRLVIRALERLSETVSMKSIAESIGVSPTTVSRWLRYIDCTKPNKLPKVLSIDEFKGNTEYGKFQCILTAPTESRVLDILPTRYKAQIYEYLRKFPNRKDVKYFVCDMNKDYADVARSLFPDATIVIDRYHVVRQCGFALENVRKRVQKHLLKGERRFFKRSKALLIKRRQNLTDDEKDIVARILQTSSDLSNAYLLKEAFYEFTDSKSLDEAKSKLLAFKMYAQAADLPEFKACLTMLNNWEKEILNMFTCPYTNGFTEGCNNTIKVIKRVSYGYHSFRNFRTRILAHFNKRGHTPIRA